MKNIILLLVSVLTLGQGCGANEYAEEREGDAEILPGAWRTEEYFPHLKGKNIALLGNHTSVVGDVHLTDTLLASDINLVKVFSPEHGFRGEAAHGEYVESHTDDRTGLPVYSLYGANRRPKPEYLHGIDLLIVDIQDVGARFYTYISTMTYVMEELARQGIPVLVLDRPNPNGHYVDGPVLDPSFSSFVGLHPVPVVHGMTIGEYAQMVNGEGWLGEGLRCELQVVEVKNYKRDMYYQLPLAPSPNLPDMTSVLRYPGLCFFEGTQISLGRGTDYPFQMYGHPDLPGEHFPFRFIPEKRRAAPNPPQLGQECFGVDLRTPNPDSLMAFDYLDLSHLLKAWEHFPNKDAFFNNFFNRLAGTDQLKKQIMAGKTEEEIRASWQPELEKFKQMRKKYLIYPDN